MSGMMADSVCLCPKCNRTFSSAYTTFATPTCPYCGSPYFECDTMLGFPFATEYQLMMVKEIQENREVVRAVEEAKKEKSE